MQGLLDCEKPDIGRPLILGAIVILSFFSIFLGWAIFSPLESAAIAKGEVGAIGKQKIIKHLEGGIVSEIFIKDGDKVAKDQILIRLDKTQPAASLSLIQSRFHAQLALQARLKSEQAGLDSIEYPKIFSEPENQNIQNIMETQTKIFDVRKLTMQKKRGILQQRIEQNKAEIKGLQQAIRAHDRQLSLLMEEISAYKELEAKGMSAGKIRMLSVQKDHARISGARSKNVAAIARTNKNIGETELRISTLETEQQNEIAEQLRETQNEIYELNEKLRAAKDVLDRTDVRAPITGTIVGLKIHTLGGVIGSGESILGIVPSNEQLIISAKIEPHDIDVVRPGLEAQVRFTAFSSRTHSPVDAKVTNVSADRFTDERSGTTYYEAEITLSENLNDTLNGMSLYPGMQAEVIIITGSRTPMDYLLEPLVESINRAFRES